MEINSSNSRAVRQEPACGKPLDEREKKDRLAWGGVFFGSAVYAFELRITFAREGADSKRYGIPLPLKQSAGRTYSPASSAYATARRARLTARTSIERVGSFGRDDRRARRQQARAPGQQVRDVLPVAVDQDPRRDVVGLIQPFGPQVPRRWNRDGATRVGRRPRAHASAARSGASRAMTLSTRVA